MANSRSQPGRSLAVPGLLPVLAENWWLLLLRGLAAIAFGVLAFVWPGPTVFTLVILFAAYSLTDGVLALWVAATGGLDGMVPRWWLVVVGLLGVAVAVLTFVWPLTTALVLLYFIAGWAVAMGVFTIIGALSLRKEIEGEWMLIATGLLSVAFGLFLFFQPGAGAIALVWLIGTYALLFGIILVALAIRLKQHKPA